MWRNKDTPFKQVYIHLPCYVRWGEAHSKKKQFDVRECLLSSLILHNHINKPFFLLFFGCLTLVRWYEWGYFETESINLNTIEWWGECVWGKGVNSLYVFFQEHFFRILPTINVTFIWICNECVWDKVAFSNKLPFGFSPLWHYGKSPGNGKQPFTCKKVWDICLSIYKIPYIHL